MKKFAATGNNSGFTLAELLIAMLIFSLVVSMTYAAFTATFRVIDRAGSASEYAERARITLERIVEDLESLHFGENGIFEGKETIYGELRGDSLSFTSRAHLLFHKEADPAGYATISYNVVEDEGNNELRLYRSDTPFLPGGREEEDGGFLLCDELLEVAFTYIDENGDERDNWDSILEKENESVPFPTAVRVKIVFPHEEKEDGTLSLSTLVAIPSSGEM